jgi:hypothetical protein
MTDQTSTLTTDVPSLHNMLKTAVAKLMSHSQTVQELIKANMDLRAALHMAQTDKAQLEEYVKSILAPDAAPAAEEVAPVADAAPAA